MVSALFVTSSTLSCGAKAISSARNDPPVETLLTWVPLGRLNETTRLGPSPAKRHVFVAATPLGPDVALFPVAPANGGDAVICLTKVPFLASTASTDAFERSPR